MRDNKWIANIKKIVPQVLWSLGGYFVDCLDGDSNLFDKSITFSGGTGLFNFAVSWKIS